MVQLCPHCHTGKIELRKVVFVQWQSPQTVVVDHIPAMVCDNCGEKSYDPRALDNLHQLLWTPFDSKRSSHTQRAHNQ